MRMPGYPSGVPSQFAVHYHPWPTRFHGPLYQRPVFGYPWMAKPQNVFKPEDFYPEPQAGVGLVMSERSQGLLNGLVIGTIGAALVTYFVCRRAR